MTRPATPVHYLRANERNWSPPSVIFLDTETRQIQTGDTDILGLRLWVARYTDRKPIKGKAPRHVTAWGRTAPELVQWINQATANRETVWLFTHNLGFDLTTTRLPLALTHTGWEIRDAAVGGRAPWLRVGRGKRVLTLVDSGSWLPMPLEEVAIQCGMVKPPLPGNEDTDQAWLHRCGHDVDILATAMLDLMGWWDRNKLGNWTISGAACGWNAYRHTPTDTPVVIDPEPQLVKRDRAFVHGGRRGTWRIGSFGHGPYWELDFVSAYPTVARELPHPVGRAYPFDSLPTDSPNLDSDRWGVTASCLIRTDVPGWPVRLADATWYPVGTFWADLAGPDIREAKRLGVLLEIGPGEVHKLAPNMAPWARWVLDVQAGRDPDQPPVARLAAKNWGRAVIGKWSQHAFVKTAFGPAPTLDWGYEEGWDHETGTAGGWLDLAGRRWWIHSGGDPDNAYPAIQAWVEAEVRVRLNRVIAAVGERAVIQCDTDGMIVDGRLLATPAAGGHLVAPDGWPAQARLNWVLDNIDPVAAPLALRLKSRTTQVTVLGPQHVVTDRQRRFAGLSKDALLGDDGKYHAKLWPSFQWQLSHGDRRGYVRPTRSVRMDGPFPTGWILDSRRVVPIQTSVTDDGRTVITPWHLTRYAAAGLHRGDTQHQALDALI